MDDNIHKMDISYAIDHIYNNVHPEEVEQSKSLTTSYPAKSQS
jgi:hypothetical protein